MAKKKETTDQTPKTVAKPATKKASKPVRSQKSPGGDKANATIVPKTATTPASAAVSKETIIVAETDAETCIDAKREAIKQQFDALPVRFQVFIEAFVSTTNATKAAIKAGYSANSTSAATIGHKLRHDPRLKPIIDFMLDDHLRDIAMTRERVLAEIEAMAKGDAGELVELRRVCCRFCHNPDHVYMETPAEHRARLRKFERDTAVARAANVAEVMMPEWDETIILGFNGTLPPDETCPECFGEGTESLVFKDTRYLSPEARALYAGANWGKDGLKVNTYSRETALDRLARHHKLYEDKTEVNIVGFTPAELEATFVTSMNRAHERMAKVREERGLTPDE